MKHIPFCLLLCSSLLITAAGCSRKSTVHLKLNGIPLSDATVLAPSSKNKSGITNSQGEADFTVKKRRFNRDGTLRVQHGKLALDTTFVLPMRRHVWVVLMDPFIPQSRQKTLKNDLLPKIAQADSLLNEIEREINAYVLLHPDSNVEEYKQAIAYRREELEGLKARVKNLYGRYGEVIKDMSDGDVEDFGDAEVEFAKAMEEFRIFTNLTRKTYDQGKQVLASDPDTDFRTDIFFDPGEFEIGTLTYEQNRNIQSFYQKIERCLNSPAFRGKKGVRIKLDAYGYTDGIPCGQSTYNRMAATGECTGNLTDDNGNLCLSRLRARSIRSQITDLIPPEYKVLGQFWGKGSKLAQNERDNRARLRKCTLTFSIYTEEIMQKHR